jgi:adenylate cyclase
LALQPDSSSAHVAKSNLYFEKHQWGPSIAEAETAVAENPNNAWAHADAGFNRLFLGHSEEGFRGVETALRLSPRDPGVPYWQFYMCHLYVYLAQWEQAIPWCNKAAAGAPQFFITYLLLASANAWAGHDKEAKEAAAQLQKVYPGFSVQGWLGIHWSDDPTFNAQYQRTVEGLRKAGVPEGEAKKD